MKEGFFTEQLITPISFRNRFYVSVIGSYGPSNSNQQKKLDHDSMLISHSPCIQMNLTRTVSNYGHCFLVTQFVVLNDSLSRRSFGCRSF